MSNSRHPFTYLYKDLFGMSPENCDLCGLTINDCKCPKCPGCNYVIGTRSCAGKEGHLPDIIPSALNLVHILDFLNQHHDLKTEDEVIDRISRILRFRTICGLTIGIVDLDNMKSFDAYHSDDGHGILIAGFCEGVNGDFPVYELFYPITQLDFWNAVKQADQDSVQVWNQTHGCRECATHYNNLHPDDSTPIYGKDGKTPVHPECNFCYGVGLMLTSPAKE